MTNVFEGKPDGRQSSDVTEKVSRFRPRYRALSDAEKELHDAIKTKADELSELFNRASEFDPTPHSNPIKLRYRALSFTALEEAVMWNVKALTTS